MNNYIREMRQRYGRSTVYAIAYGSSDLIASKYMKGSPRLVKKKLGKLRSLVSQANFCLGVYSGETYLLKSKIKKGCRKGKSFVKVFRVKDQTVYCTVTKHRHGDGNTTNTIENLTWI